VASLAILSLWFDGIALDLTEMPSIVPSIMPSNCLDAVGRHKTIKDEKLGKRKKKPRFSVF